MILHGNLDSDIGLERERDDDDVCIICGKISDLALDV